MISMYIGSGDVKALLMKKESKGFQDFCRKFFSGEKPYYNALASPIDALRTGAILEERYYLILPEGYFPQYKVTSSEMDVLTASIDFGYIEAGELADFDELKTCFSTDFLILQDYKDTDYETYISFLKKTYKEYYNQVQEQLYCSGLESCNLVFLEVQNYVDDENWQREIKEGEYIKFRIKRDDDVISKIKDRAGFFQQLKDYFK